MRGKIKIAGVYPLRLQCQKKLTRTERPETYSVITPATKDNIQPGTEKSKTRFQLDDVDDTMSERRIQALQDQNEALKQANDLLEQQFKLTDKDAVRTEDIKKLQEIS